MKKDAYYFPHFCNARHDRKLKRVQKELGVEGYGIFFMLLEVLREQTDFRYPMDDLDLLADEFGTSEQKLRAVVCNYKLFEVNSNKNFFSPKLVFYIQPYIERTKRAREAARIRWANSKKSNEKQCVNANAYANALPEHCLSNAKERRGEERKGEERKGKERKINKSKTKNQKIPPTIDEVKLYCLERKNNIDPEHFIDFYTSKNWMVGKNKMKDWKASVRTWERNNNSKYNNEPDINYREL